MLSVQYVAFLCHYLKEWRKNPQWSFSCCLAVLLPLSDFNGEVPDLIESDVITNQLQTGQIDMPTVLGAVNDSGVITVTHVEGEQGEHNENDVVDVRKAQDIHNHRMKYYYMYNSKCHQGTQTELTRNKVSALSLW